MYSHSGDFEYAFENDVTQRKRSESDAYLQRDATRERQLEASKLLTNTNTHSTLLPLKKEGRSQVHR